nr:hypothetical protein [Tanacetum cinerariifolium]
MTTPFAASTTDSQMHNNIMAAGPYTPTTVVVPAVPTTDDSLAIPEHTTVETPINMSPENKAHYQSEKEAIDLILTGIGDEIYSTVDACKTTQETWEAIERLQQEWSRFVTIVKQQYKLDEVSYHKLFDILKQYQKEVNELRAKRIARNANPLVLVSTAQPNQDPYYQTVILVPWSSIHILVLEFEEVLRLLLVESNSNRGVIDLAISLPLFLVVS